MCDHTELEEREKACSLAEKEVVDKQNLVESRESGCNLREK